MRHHRTVMASLSLVALMLVSAIPSPRGDAATLDVIGFSEDGRFLAFEQHGEIEARPAYWSEFYFIEVARNAWAAPPVRFADAQMLPDSVRAHSRRRAQPLLDSLGIRTGNRGQHLLSHRFTDTGVDPHKAQFVIGTPPRIGKFFESFDLTLTPWDAGSMCGDFGTAKLFRLTLRPQHGEEIILQEDVRLPKSRGCPLDYRIQDVYLYNRTLAVFLNMMLPGWEGHDMRYLVVTGAVD